MPSLVNSPVIFLAFSNDRYDGQRYLRNLPEEIREVRAALERARVAGLCELVERPNATLQEIFDIFQRPEYRGRIAVFHFSGHADGYQLAFEGPEGRPRLADGRHLADFLKEQHALKLVFLNGCATQPQIEALLGTHVPAIIATSQASV